MCRPEASTTVAMTVFNRWFTNQTAAYIALPKVGKVPVLKIFACVDAESCAWAAAASTNAAYREQGFRFWQLPPDETVTTWAFASNRCYGWRAVHLPKVSLCAQLLKCGCNVVVFDEDYLITPETLRLLDDYPSVDVIGARDAANRRCPVGVDTALMGCHYLNFGPSSSDPPLTRLA
jgi:hypothetical protein